MKTKLVFISLVIMVILISQVGIAVQNSKSVSIEEYADVSNKNLASYDFRNSLSLLLTLTFDTNTKWPSKAKMPADFDPAKILEYGKDPGLGIKELHQKGYTGKGVNVAYIDQPLLTNHEAYKSLNVIYTKIKPETKYMETSMHGPAVLSLLAGREIGVAPESTVYFFGHPAWLMDQTTHAEALHSLIQVNQKLPPEQQIRVVGFSDTPDPREKNIEAYQSAIQDAENSGIMVFDVETLRILPLAIQPFKDKDDPKNYEAAHWFSSFPAQKGSLGVPCNRTTATGYPPNPKSYIYWKGGGLSWTVPYIVGVIALGLQVDPALSKDDILRYLNESAYPFKNGGIINPEGFIKLVEANKPRAYPEGVDYYYLLYNGSRVSESDLKAIKVYAKHLGRDKETILKDVSGYEDAYRIYEALKTDALKRKGSLKGVQIFGTADDVPAFDIHFKIQMQKMIDDSGSFKSDFFYSSFRNDPEVLKDDFSIYKNFAGNLKVDFLPDWPISRLPLTKGEIGTFIQKYGEYISQLQTNSPQPIVNFSSPIFPQKEHIDDMSFFIKNRLDKEFGFINESQYRLYGNKLGSYPVATKTAEDYTKENLKAENEKGIVDFFINGHGQGDNLDQTVFRSANPNSEQRISFINRKNINEFLGGNYYTLTLLTCLNAWDLNKENLIHEAMARGKCMNSLAATSIISNNGINNRAPLGELKKNNFYYFHYHFFENFYRLGKSRSDSFYNAKKAYVTEILKNTKNLGEGNYQFNLHNVLAYHYLGLIEYPATANQELVDALKFIKIEPGEEIQNSYNSTDSMNTDAFNNVNCDVNIGFKTSVESTNLKILNLKAGKSDNNIVFALEYESGISRVYCFFDPPNGTKLKIINWNGIQPGKNIVKFAVPLNSLKDISLLTMRFFTREKEEANFIFINFADLKNMLDVQ